MQEDEFQRNTAHVNNYPELDQLVTRASNLAADGRYAEALAIYTEAVETRPDTVVPVDREPGRGAWTRARGVWDYVLGQVAAWPEEGKALYRRRTDPHAEQLFQTAKRNLDLDALERLIESYPLSSYVDDALAFMANHWLDAGENERAAAALARLLTVESEVPRPVTIARLGTAYSRAGQKALLADLLGRASRDHPDAAVRAGGREVKLVDHLRALARETREGEASKPALSLPSWEVLAGAPSGSRLAEPGVELSRLAWAATVGLNRFQGEEDFSLRRAGGTLALTPDFRPLFPAVADGILYVHNETRLHAYNFFARPGEKPLWEFQVLPPPAGEAMFDNRVIYGATVHEGRVFANLMTTIGGAEDQLGYVRVKFPFPRRALFAFDAYQGRLLWKLGGQVRSPVLEDNATFSAPPAPDGERLYAGAVKQQFSTDPFEHYLLCLDAATGRVLWSTFVASGGTEINLFGNSTRESLGSPVALSDDAAFYVTNHGVAAAVEKKTGRIRWVYRYQQLPVNPTRSVYVMKNRLGWVNSPPVVAAGVVAVTPTDSPYVYGLDARTGEVRWQRARERDVRTLYGARDATLVLGGDRLEFVDIRTGKLLAQTDDGLSGTGRGVLAEDGVYVAGRDKFRKVGWNGQWDEAEARPWPGGRGEGGNLAVVDGAVVLATQDAVEVYFDRRDQEKFIRAELEKDPRNLAALYGGALRFLQSGDVEEAVRLFARVVAQAEGSSKAEDERLYRAARKRLYAVSLQAGRADLDDRRLDRAREHFLRARAVAPEARARAEASLMLGRVHEAAGDPAAAVREFQRLLQESAGEGPEPDATLALARDAIASVLRAAGRRAYQAEEAEARRLLEQARRQGTPDGLLRIFRLYPNSEAAEEGLLAAAAAQARLGRPDDEIATLRRYLREFPGSARGAEAYAALVRALEGKGQHAAAAPLLRRMLRAFPDAEVADGGRRLTVRDFAGSRLKQDAYARAVAPAPSVALAPPLKRVFEHTEKDYRDGIPIRPAGTPPSAAADFLLMDYGTAVKAFGLSHGREVWRLKTAAKIQFAAFDEELLLLADELGAYCVDPRDGAVRWRYSSRAPMRGFAKVGGTLCFLTSDAAGPAVGALDAARGTEAWAQSFEGSPGPSVHAAEDAAVFITSLPNRIHLFDAGTGRRLLAEAAYSPGAAAEVEHVTDAQIVIRCEGRFLESYALPAGNLQWRVNLQGRGTRDLQVGEGGLVVLGTVLARGVPERPFLAVIDLRTGKFLQMREDPDLGDPRFLEVDGAAAYVVSREADRSLAARRVRLADLTVEWTANLGQREATLFPPELTREHLVVGTFESDPAGQYAYGAALLDKRGKSVQNIRSEFRFERPPSVTAAHDRLIFSVDTKVEVYR